MARKYLVYSADDDEDDRLLLERAFQQQFAECQLVFFTDGDELLSKLTTLHAAEFPGLIILDLNMPRMNGFETLRQIKSNQHLRSIPVVIMTTSTDADDIARTYQAGSNSFLTKPANYDRLQDLVKVTREYWFETVTVPYEC